MISIFVHVGEIGRAFLLGKKADLDFWQVLSSILIERILDLASTGFASTVRLAKSNPDTWQAIFDKNREHLTTALGYYIDNLKKFKTALEGGHSNTTYALMQEANAIKKILN